MISSGLHYNLSSSQRGSVMGLSEDEINSLLQSRGFSKREATEEPDEETDRSDL